MKYLLDKNVLTGDLISNVNKRDDLCIIEDVLEEAGYTKQEIIKIKGSGVQILRVARKHLEKLIELMAVHGDNFKLINLYAGKGTADVVMLAYILSEREKPETLFTEEYTIVTKDRELATVATSHGIKSVSKIT